MSRQVWEAIEDIADEARKKKKKKQKKEKAQKERKKEFRKLIMEEEIKIAKMIKEKEDLMEIRTVEEIVSRRFYKYLKVFEKKKSKRMWIRKIWDYAIDLREVFVLKKKEISVVKNREGRGSGVFEESNKKGVYLTIKITIDIISILCAKEE